MGGGSPSPTIVSMSRHNTDYSSSNISLPSVAWMRISENTNSSFAIRSLSRGSASAAPTSSRRSNASAASTDCQRPFALTREPSSSRASLICGSQARYPSSGLILSWGAVYGVQNSNSDRFSFEEAGQRACSAMQQGLSEGCSIARTVFSGFA